MGIYVKKHGVRLLLILLGTGLFMLLFSQAVRLLTDLPLSKFLPGYLDMADYHIEINSAVGHGIVNANAGYHGYVSQNNLYVADWLNYGAHGLFVLLPYYLCGIVIGWGGASPLIAHAILLTAAFAVVYFCTKSYKKTLIVQVVTFTFVPLLIYFPNTMMEIQMYAWSIASIALVWAYVRRPTIRNQIGLLVVVVLASAVRVTNVVFLIPYLVITVKDCLTRRADRKRNARNLLLGVLAIISVGMLFLINTRLSAPYPFTFLKQLGDAFSLSVGDAVKVFSDHFVQSLIAWFNPMTAPIFVFARYATFGLALFLAIQGFRGGRRQDARPKFRVEMLSLSAILFSIMFLNIMFYTLGDWRDFRVVVPILFAVLLYNLFLFDKKPITAGVCLTVCILFLSHLSHSVDFIKLNFGEFYHNEYASYMKYDANAPTRFGNTVVISGSIGNTCYDLDAGLGVLYDFGGSTGDGMAEIGARYILTNRDSGFEAGEHYDAMRQGEDYIIYRLNE